MTLALVVSIAARLRRVLAWALSAALLALPALPAWCALATDVTVSTNRSTAGSNITSPTFTTASANELLLAFVATDARSPGMIVTGMTGAGLGWTLVRRTNAQLGTAEIWRAFAPSRLTGVSIRANLSQSAAASITVVSFTGADTSGTGGSGAIGATGSGNASTGAPTASLVTTRDNSWVFGVGNDYDNAIARTVPPNQGKVNEYLATIGDTYWVQRLNSPTASAGTPVTINDTAPTGDRFNLTLVEVLAALPSGAGYTVSGTLPSLGTGASVALRQNANLLATATADASGAYSFSSVANGTYMVTPAKTGVSFSPASQTVTVNGANVTVATFTATAATYAVSGTVTPASLGAGSTMTLRLNGNVVATATADAGGVYGFSSLANGTYTVTPTKTGVSFSPTVQTVTVNGANVVLGAFTASSVGSAFTVSGSITPGTQVSGTGATVALTQGTSTVATTTATASGTYSFAGVVNGTYTVTPSKSGVSFSPASRSVTVNGANVTVAAFAASSPGSLNQPDLSVIIPSGRMAVVNTANGREFQYTHDTFNGGSGPLVIQPVYNATSGTYLGTQYLYTYSSGTWTLSRQVPVAGGFFFHEAHGHFHFPFATFGLYAVGSDGGPGSPVAISEKNGFCINDSFIYDPSLPNAGALGNLGSCSDPTSLRGLNIGAVDEYDKSDPGQSISLAGVPDGTYWLRAIVDPDNYLAESDESNNETDVLVSISGNTVTELRKVTPVLPPPPDITLASPSDQSTVSGTANLTASTTAGTAVQFLLDGVALGAPVASPFTLAWNTGTVPDGVHWLAAQTQDPVSGRTGTSAVAKVTVANGATQPPTVTVTSPAAGATVSAITALGATVASSSAITGVRFFVDGQPVGASLTAPPYLLYWDSQTVSDGPHVVTAQATNSFNLVGTSPEVNVTVDNSHPPNVIGMDATVFRDASDSMTTPAFSTRTPSDLIVAFVAYDGPTSAAQTASVSGAGLAWTLAMRSNSQHGTSEIWVAKASAVLSNVTVTSQPSLTGYHGSLVVVAFTNASGPGVVGRASAPTGAPDIILPGVSAGNWVFAVGNDWDRAIARVPVAGQVLVHQRVDTGVGDTFWVQSTSTPSTANALVTIHDSSPTTDQWNYAAVEIVATRP